MRAARGPHQQQVGNVCARNEHDEEPDRHELNPHTVSDPLIVVVVDQDDRGANPFVGLRIVVRQACGDGVQLRLGLCDRGTLGQASDRAERADVPALPGQSRHQRERLPEIGVIRKLETVRHHTDHDRRHTIDVDRLADDARIAPVSRLPDAISKDDHAMRARLVLFGQKIAAQEWWLPSQPERTGRNVRAEDAIGRASLVAERHLCAGERRHTCEGSCRGSHILKIAKRHPEFVVTNVARPDVHHTVGTIDRQTSDAEGIDDREQCVIDANA